MKIKDLLSDESKWIKRNNAQDKDGNVVYIDSDDACKFCLFGAVRRCYRTHYEQEQVADIINDIVVDNNLSKNFIKFNDDPRTTFEDIRKVLEEADV